jgi:hypothetical protein
MDIKPTLRVNSDALLATIDRLRDLEVEKRGVAPGSGRFLELADEIRRLASGVLDTSDLQRELAEASNAVAEAGRPDLVQTPIDAIRPVREVQVVLAQWRDAERRLSAAREGSEEATSIELEVSRLRDEYRRSLDAAVERSKDR